MSRIKKQILSKLKEYESKMGTNTLGGDDYTAKKRGGLRDFDGYDNVDYNKDMPMDEAYVVLYSPKKGVKPVSTAAYRDKKDAEKWAKDLGGITMIVKKKIKGVDEAKLSTIHKAAKKGSYPVSLVVIKNGKVIKQVLNIKTPAEVPAAFNVVKNYHKHKDATVHIEDRTGKRLFSEACWKGYKAVGGKIKNGKQVPNCVPESIEEDSPESAHPQGSKKLSGRTTVMDMLDVISHKEFGPDYHKLSTKQKKEVHKLAIKGKLIKQSSFKESVNESLNRNDMYTMLDIAAGYSSTQDQAASQMWSDEQDLYDYLKSDHIPKKYHKKFYKDIQRRFKGVKESNESVNEGPIDRVIGGRPYKYQGDGRKGKAIVSGPMKDKDRNDIIKRAKKAGYIAKPNMGGGVTVFIESIEEGMFSAIDQIRQDSKDVRDFVKNVFKDKEFKKMSNDKEFIKYLKSIYEGVTEGGIPQNFHQGRTSDYHTALRGKNKDYSGGTNFKKTNHGQPDLENDEEDQEIPKLSNKQTMLKVDGKKKKFNEGFDKVEHLSLLNKAMRAIPGSQKQKDIIRQLNKIRKAGGMRPLKEQSVIEYAQRLDFSFIPDEESKLDGTPEDIKAIDEKAKRDYKDEYKKFQSSTKSKKYRAELNKYNRQKGTYGNGDGKDASHKGGKIVGFESASKNRGRKEKSRLKKK